MVRVPCQRPSTSPGRWHQLSFLCPRLPSLYRRPPDWWGTICPWWSCAVCLRSPPHLTCALMCFSGEPVLWSSQVQKPAIPQILLSPFLKNRSDVSLSLVTRGLIRQPWFLKYDDEQLSNHISQLPWGPRMHIIWPNRLLHLQSCEAVSEVLFPYLLFVMVMGCFAVVALFLRRVDFSFISLWEHQIRLQ